MAPGDTPAPVDLARALVFKSVTQGGIRREDSPTATGPIVTLDAPGHANTEGKGSHEDRRLHKHSFQRASLAHCELMASPGVHQTHPKSKSPGLNS